MGCMNVRGTQTRNDRLHGPHGIVRQEVSFNFVAFVVGQYFYALNSRYTQCSNASAIDCKGCAPFANVACAQPGLGSLRSLSPCIYIYMYIAMKSEMHSATEQESRFYPVVLSAEFTI